MAISTEAQGGSTRVHDARHHGFAFLIEALAVVVFLMASLAIFVRLFSSAQLEGLRANRTSEAVLLATNCAEEFSANPQAVPKTSTLDGLTIACEVVPNQHTAGILYEAHITVSDSDTTLYELTTARYVSGQAAEAGEAA